MVWCKKSTKVTMLFGSLLFFLLFCGIATTSDESISACESSLSPVSRTILSLSSKLIKGIEGEENFLISPLSLSVSLAMLYVGTEGTTKAQMTNALWYQFDRNNCMDLTLMEVFRDLILSLDSKSEAYSLLVANSVFIHSSYPVSPDYVARLQDFFNSDVKYFDFAKDQALSMEVLNNWVSNQTRGQIPKLLNEPLDPLTIMLMMNVVYFKGLWENSFPSKNTKYSLFRRNDTSKIIPFMTQKSILGFYYDPIIKYFFLEMKYTGAKISMLLALPENDKEFPNFELNGESLCNIKSNLQPTKVMVILPKFRMEYTRELTQDMIKMGIGEIFSSDKADLSGIRPQKDIHVSLMMHKALIEVNEKGSEASAVSGLGIDSRRRPLDSDYFWADHPFLFYIIDNDTNAVLFAGRVVDP